MKYVVLVSHGLFAEGLFDALKMLAGKRDDVIAVGLHDGQSADEFAQVFNQAISQVTSDDEIILLIGGSPLTTAMNVIAEHQMSQKTLVIGGMNLPLALTTVLMKDAFAQECLKEQILNEAHGALKEFKVVSDDEEDI